MCGSCPGGGLIFVSAALGVGLSLPAALDWQNSESFLAEADDAVTLSDVGSRGPPLLPGTGWRSQMGLDASQLCCLAEPLVLVGSQASHQVEKK